MNKTNLLACLLLLAVGAFAQDKTGYSPANNSALVVNREVSAIRPIAVPLPALIAFDRQPIHESLNDVLSILSKSGKGKMSVIMDSLLGRNGTYRWKIEEGALPKDVIGITTVSVVILFPSSTSRLVTSKPSTVYLPKRTYSCSCFVFVQT